MPRMCLLLGAVDDDEECFEGSVSTLLYAGSRMCWRIGAATLLSF